MRVQRTRSSPSALRSPLTRYPLGAGRPGVAVALVATALSCRLVPPASVAGQLRNLAGRGIGATVRLADLTDFKWSRFVWLAPYTMRQQADSALGFAWPDYDKFDLERSDSFSLVVFAENDHVVRVEKMQRGQGEFVDEVSATAFSPADALFKVVNSHEVFLFAPVTKSGA